MFTTIRKHQTWLWGFIIAAVIVSFVIYFTPTGRSPGGGGRGADFGSIHGRPIDRKEYTEAYFESQLGFFMRNGVWPGTVEARQSGFSVERETRNRLLLLDRVRELKIKPDESAVAAWIVENFGGPTPNASAKARYESLLRDLRRHHVTDADFHKFIQHEIAINHLASIAGLTGRLVTPRAAADLLRESQERIDADAAVFSATNYLVSVQMDPAAVAQFFTNRQSVYRIPERVQVQYVVFPQTNYVDAAEVELAKRTNLAAEIDRAYQASNPSNFTDTNGQVLAPDAAKAKLRQTLRDRQALVEAHKAAANFATELDTSKAASADDLVKLATSKGLTFGVTEPFSESDGPAGVNVRPNFVEVAFKLSPQQPIAISPIRAEDAVYVIALKQRFPSEVPQFESIRARVEQDFRRDEALRLARKAATNFIAKLTNEMAQGKTFAAVCAEANVTQIKLPTFSAAAQAGPEWDRRIELNQAKAAAAGVEVGKVSRLIPTRDGAFVLHVRARTPVSDNELKQELPKFLASMRQSEQYKAFNDWFQRQIEVTRIVTYMGREQREQGAQGE